ncbi:dienelactone hydrolase family protein [Roseateles puraquae]|uniref:Carboxymethylenebutenolidase n=1 Tax=Roseateles puraquae TaxID=431059 RepID=A0A254NGB5_9BURK|nr:dienelactone hydrolase family protein [Roseateles puraquae]MDG0852233.1 dienelactone hydrolase family protein [Roseateles puraquae]OWR04093.1 carboxymethylenebutenolidase [Roseateles puraquae]
MTSPRDIPDQAWPLFDRYVHGDLSRRGFLEQAAAFAGGPAGAAALLAALSPNFAAAQQVKPDDARLVTRRLAFPSPAGNGQVNGYLAKPASAMGKLPAVLVVHENRGLNPHIEDIARRVALAGYVAYAPDALTPLGGYPGNEDDARALFAKLDPAKARADIVAAARGLLTLADANGKLGVVGFCWGGSLSNHVATQVPELAVAVPFYGGAPAAEDVPRIKAQLLIHYAANDERINAAWPAYEAALKAAGVRYEAHTYPGTQHGFNNDTTPRYDAAAAELAWERTLAAFKAALA